MRSKKITANGVPILYCDFCGSDKFKLLLIDGEKKPIVACDKCGAKYGEFEEFREEEDL